MAKIKNGHFGSYQGKIGAVTGVKRRGKFYIRQSITQNLSNTPSQQKVRRQFAHVSTLMGAFANVLSIGFRHASQTGATAYNAGFGFNYDQADKLTGELDPSKVVVSRGSLVNIASPSVACSGAHTLKATWTDNSDERIGTQADDLVYMVIYDKVGNLTTLGVAKRADANLTLPLPVDWTGRSVYVYFFTTTISGDKNSDSLYANTISVE